MRKGMLVVVAVVSLAAGLTLAGCKPPQGDPGSGTKICKEDGKFVDCK
jgi:hypothetical protein